MYNYKDITNFHNKTLKKYGITKEALKRKALLYFLLHPPGQRPNCIDSCQLYKKSPTIIQFTCIEFRYNLYVENNDCCIWRFLPKLTKGLDKSAKE